jgi:hypothetical protein
MTKLKIAGSFFGLLFIITIALFSVLIKSAYADAEDLNKNISDIAIQEETGPLYVIKPISRITLSGFHYSDHSLKKYCFDNAEGRCLDSDYNYFADIEGMGSYGRGFAVYYRAELDDDGDLRIKKAYGKLKTGIWSWEVGKDTLWIGPGYHGSFILSNNAEGFMLVRVKTDEPFRLPWLFSYLGEFKYDLFRGWAQNFGILGHRLSLRPMPLLEIGANQVTYILPGRHYKIYEYPRALFSTSDHEGRDNRFDNDQKASIDVALDMPFLSRIPPLINGKIYAEYGGNDSFTMWQGDQNHMRDVWKHGNGKWFQPIPYDFQNIAWLAGLFLTTGDLDFRIEYAQNYASYPLFYDYYDPDVNRRHGPWYSDLNTRYGMITGHHVGNDGDDLFVEFTVRRDPMTVKINFDQERHGLSQGVDYPPEYLYQYGLMPSYRFRTFTIFADIVYNHYRNVDFDNDPLTLDIRPGTRRDEYIAGLGIEIPFY